MYHVLKAAVLENSLFPTEVEITDASVGGGGGGGVAPLLGYNKQYL